MNNFYVYKICTHLLAFDENCAHTAHFVDSRLTRQTRVYKKRAYLCNNIKGKHADDRDCSRQGIAIAKFFVSYVQLKPRSVMDA